MTDAIDTAAELAAAQQKLTEATAAHAAAQAAAAVPRAVPIIMGELLTHFVSRFGNHPELEKLLTEFKAAAGL